MSTDLIINASLPETRIALLENGEIQELLIERASGKGIVGNIYKGRVTRVLPGMQAAFVDIGLEKAAFLYVDDVFVHSEIWEEEEGGSDESANEESTGEESTASDESTHEEPKISTNEAPEPEVVNDSDDFEDSEDSEDSDDEGPMSMGGEDESKPEGTVAPPEAAPASAGDAPAGEAPAGETAQAGAPGEGAGRRKRHRRGRRGGKNRRRGAEGQAEDGEQATAAADSGAEGHEAFSEHVEDEGFVDSDRSELGADAGGHEGEVSSRPQGAPTGPVPRPIPVAAGGAGAAGSRPEFRENRDKNRRIKAKPATARSSSRAQVNIQDLLKEGQEVLVQVAKDPIATKGARLTCHISLPGRHLVCMPTIDHVGVSRRIERDDERRRLRDFVERNRPKALGFIVRTASGKQSEKRIKQDIDYLTRLWGEIQEKARTVSAPALVYEDLNAVLRAIRDWVNEEIDRIVVDSRYHYNEIHRFVAHFMPSLRQKVELYQGDVPIFDARNISSELARALERKVWLKSGGYIVIDQAEALVAIDVNTGRFVGKKNLEDTILKTNLEAVQEIAYQLRLRNCGGIIVLDLIDMEKEENKQRVYRALEEALRKDRARPSIQKISELGLIEMTRKRTRDTMVRALCESCSHCEGKGFVKSRQTVAYEVLRDVERDGIDRDVRKVLVQAHPDVIDLLAIDERETLDQLERRFRKPIYLQAIGDYHAEQFEVIADRVAGSSARDRVGRERDRERERRQERQREREKAEKEREKEREAVRTRLEAQRQSKAIQAANAPAMMDQLDEAAPQEESMGQAQGHGQSHGQGHRGGQRQQGQQRQGSGGPIPRPQPQPQPQPQVRVEPQAPVDPDAIGNRAEVATHLISSTTGFSQPQGGSQQAAPSDDEFMDEEDRLAYQRAQATQDAALANMSKGGGPGALGNTRTGGSRGPHGGSHSGHGGGHGGGGNRDRDRGDRGRRGRRGRGGRDRDRGPRQGGGGGGGQNAGNRQPQGGGVSSGPKPQQGGSDSSDDGHSQPPT